MFEFVIGVWEIGGQEGMTEKSEDARPRPMSRGLQSSGREHSFSLMETGPLSQEKRGKVRCFFVCLFVCLFLVTFIPKANRIPGSPMIKNLPAIQETRV